jgi:MurNAc alpha-1-phosphate uridylyltransferase
MIAPKTAMLLAAGLGTRMRPLTDRTAKPLLPLAGKTLIDHALDRLEDAGVERVVVNAHWHADLVGAHLRARQGRPETELRHESQLLDTAGAVQAALAEGRLGDDPFFVVNGDAFWLDGPNGTLGRMEEAFDPDKVDALLLMHRTFQVMGDTGLGDFLLDKWGEVRRRGEREVAPYVYAGVQLISPALFAGVEPGALSMNTLWDRAIEAGRLAALVHDGLWFHLSTPADLVEAETSLRDRALGETR